MLDKKETEHEVSLFSVRGETAQLLEKYAKRIEELEQEVDKLKTLQDIQVERNASESESHQIMKISLSPLPESQRENQPRL